MRLLLSMLIFLCGFWGAELAAQAGIPSVQYGTGDGLSSETVYCIFQDSKGFLWIGTDVGALRFDGKNFSAFTTENGLSGNEIFQIHEDSQGRIWFLTLSGKPAFMQEGQIFSFKNHPLLAEIEVNKFSTSWAEDSLGRIWIGNRNGWHRIDLEKGELEGQSSLSGPIAFWPQKEEEVLLVDQFETWSSTAPPPGKKYRIQTQNARFLSPRISEFYRGNAYLVARDSVFSLIPKAGAPRKFLFKFKEGAVFIRADEQGLWIGSMQGLFLYPWEGKGQKREHFFPEMQVNYLFQDANGAYWLGGNRGLLFLPQIRGRIWTGEWESDFRSLLPGKSGEILALGHNRELLKLRGWATLSENLQMIVDKPNDLSFAAKWEGEECLIGGTFGLARIRPGGGRLDKDLIPGAFKVRDIVKARDGSFWVANYQGLRQMPSLDPASFRAFGLRNAELYPDSLLTVSGPVYDLLLDPEDRLWVGGLRLFCLENGEIQKFPSVDSLLGGNRINGMAYGAEGSLYLATNGGGLIVYKKGETIRYTQQRGLSDNMCHTVYCDGQGRVWVGGRKGVSVLFPKTGEIRSFSAKNGIPKGAVYDFWEDGFWIYLASSQGVYQLPLDDLLQVAGRAEAYFREIKAKDRVLDLDRRAVLAPDENRISFSFAQVNFLQGQQNRYRYRLVGIESQYSFTQSDRVEYPVLPDGTFSFHLQAETPGGGWGPEAVFTFEIETPWFRTIAFRAGLALGISALVFGIVFAIIRTQRRRSRLKNRILEAEAKALRLQMNPHFLFNALSGIQRHILEDQKQKAVEYLGEFGAIMRGILQNSRKGAVSLEEEIEFLENYLDLELMRSEQAFSFEITVDPTLEPAEVLIPPLLIQPFLENAIWHGIHPLDKPGKVLLSFQDKGEMLEICIEDNGIGRAAAQRRKKQNPSGHTSLGMTLTRERLDLLSKSQRRKMRLEVEDLHAPSGTRVRILIPKDFVS